jgi:hypothetical protein
VEVFDLASTRALLTSKCYDKHNSREAGCKDGLNVKMLLTSAIRVQIKRQKPSVYAKQKVFRRPGNCTSNNYKQVLK